MSKLLINYRNGFTIIHLVSAFSVLYIYLQNTSSGTETFGNCCHIFHPKHQFWGPCKWPAGVWSPDPSQGIWAQQSQEGVGPKYCYLWLENNTRKRMCPVVLGGHCWWGLGDGMQCRRRNPSQMRARQTPSLLYCCSSPSGNFLRGSWRVSTRDWPALHTEPRVPPPTQGLMVSECQAGTAPFQIREHTQLGFVLIPVLRA